MSFDDKRIQQVWDKGTKVRGKDPELYRKDSTGKVIYKRSEERRVGKECRL